MLLEVKHPYQVVGVTRLETFFAIKALQKLNVVGINYFSLLLIAKSHIETSNHAKDLQSPPKVAKRKAFGCRFAEDFG